MVVWSVVREIQRIELGVEQMKRGLKSGGGVDEV
jgi:hypothetical protein